MKKLTLSVAALLIAGASFALTTKSTQCTATTKKNVQCKKTTKSKSKLCYLHDPNYVKPSKTITVVCNGTTKAGNKCKNKTKNKSGKCRLHTKKD